MKNTIHKAARRAALIPLAALVLLVFLFPGTAAADSIITADDSISGPGHSIQFSVSLYGYNAGGLRYESGHPVARIAYDQPSYITSTSYPGDPLVGYRLRFSEVYSIATYQGNNLYSLQPSGPALVSIYSNSGDTVLTGHAIPYNFFLGPQGSQGYTGFVTWGPVTDLLVNDSIHSPALAELSAYGMASMTTAFYSPDDSTKEMFTRATAGTMGVGLGTWAVTGIGSPSNVPEPSSALLVILGLAGSAALRRKLGK